MGDMVGRKWGLIMSCLVFCLGVGLQLDTKWATFIVGRVIAGFGVVCNLLGPFVSFLISFVTGACVMPRSHVSIRGMVFSTPGFPLSDNSRLGTSARPSRSADLLLDFTSCPVRCNPLPVS